jgi:hypothetical protein
MDRTINIRHFLDEQGNPVAPLSPEAAIYDESGKRLSDKLKGLNLNSIREAQDEALSAIDEKENEAIGNFSSQRVIPDMLSPEVMALIEASGGGIINNMPDGEDLTSKNIAGEKSVMQLADRPYNPSAFSGKGYTIMRKNVSALSRGGSGNILTQEMISQPNTVYDIRYDFDLNGVEVIVPKNCVLNFVGGTLKNGKIKGQNTLIAGSLSEILDNVILTGSYNNISCGLNWWKVSDTIDYDNSINIQCAFDSSINSIMVDKVYGFSQPIRLPVVKYIQGYSPYGFYKNGFRANSDFHSIQVDFDTDTKSSFSQEVQGMFYHRAYNGLTISNISIDANKQSQYCIEHIDGYGAPIIRFVGLYNALHVGILQYACEFPVWEDMYINQCAIGVYISDHKINKDNPFDFSGKSMGKPNLVSLTRIRCLNCNYGYILYGSSNIKMTDCQSSLCSIFGLFIKNTSILVTNYYTERDGLCTKYLDEDGVLLYSNDDGHALELLMTNNWDGYKSTKVNKFNSEIYWRAPIIVENSNATFISPYISVKPRSYEGYDCKDIKEPNIRDASGVDCYIIANQSMVVLDNPTVYIVNNDTANSPLYEIVDVVYPRTYTIPSTINVRFNNKKRNFNYFLAGTLVLDMTSKAFTEIDNVQIGYINTSKTEFSDLNKNVNDNRYGISNKYNINEQQYVKTVNGYPLFKIINNSAGRRSISLTKTEHTNIFGNRRQCKVVTYVEVLEDLSNEQIRIQAIYKNNGELVTSNYMNQSAPKDIKKGMYRYIMYLDLELLAEWNEFQIEFNAINYEKVLLSDILFYEIDDWKYTRPEYNTHYISQGKFENKQSWSPVGFQYFCTDKQTEEGQSNGIMIYHKGENIWVDSLGRVVE